MEGLLKLDVLRTSVMRNGRLIAADAAVLVPGDIIELTAGHHVPADARVIHATDLRTIEASLTGESLPISKRSDVGLPADTPLADRINMVYKGTTVAAGVAKAVVTATGPTTELGRIGTLVGAMGEERTPLERRLDALGRRLVWLALAVAAVVAALGAVQGTPLGLVLQIAIALSVAAVPEALPAVATIALAVGLRRMARRHALVRRLPAVEALGSTTVVCTDKTRTLTSGDMTVIRLWIANEDIELPADKAAQASVDERVNRALEVAALASRLQASRPGADVTLAGDPVDTAFLDAAHRAGVNQADLLEARPPVSFIPFSSERKLMASFHRVDNRVVAYVKGAPRRILELSDRVLSADGDLALDGRGRKDLMRINESLARDGLRVLALATGPVAAPSESALRGLTFVGFAGLIDPPAPGVKDTIERLRAAGLRTVMLTGDQRLTAETIGRQLGVLQAGDEVVDGRELDRLSETELQAKVARVGAFSRITPAHKLAVIRALQANGEIVAMLGDGVNDAPALKKADVGVAMGLRGTDVAKEAASIVLQDDRFETIAAAVEEGRIIYDNIRKFVFYLFSCNLAEVLVLLAAGLAAMPLPLLPLQVLWLNMVTDTFPALALAMEPGDPGVMSRPPHRPDEAILSRGFLAHISFYGVLIAVITLTAFVWALERSPARATTVSFMTLALAQIFHLGTARSADSVLTLGRAGTNPYALAAVALSIGLQVVSVHFEPLARLLRVVPLRPAEWATIVALAAIPAVVGQTLKLWRVRRRRQSEGA
jgi:Ca2+-transporting ATPase